MNIQWISEHSQIVKWSIKSFQSVKLKSKPTQKNVSMPKIATTKKIIPQKLIHNLPSPCRVDAYQWVPFLVFWRIQCVLASTISQHSLLMSNVECAKSAVCALLWNNNNKSNQIQYSTINVHWITHRKNHWN